MQQILFVNACVRNESRTKKIAEYFLEKADGEIITVDLGREKPTPLDEERLIMRDEALASGNTVHPILDYARQFAAADMIVIAAPYWDLSFPALLKNYMESVTAVGVTFAYAEDGHPYGLCKASKLVYITTAGGPILSDEYGYGYIQTLCRAFYGIEDVACIKAEGLDIIGADVPKILSDAMRTADEYFKQ